MDGGSVIVLNYFSPGNNHFKSPHTANEQNVVL